jgi:nitroimidazol reductase NimA-like FMN-containing flavoprotein (pyridoxamine 5'-phosphate oxidase superfamily)
MANLVNALESDRPRPTVALNSMACWDLLRGLEVGRLAVVVDGSPEIFPVNYLVDHGSIVFRSAGGTKLNAASASRVALEIDGFDAETGEAWSVVLKGTAGEITELEAVLDVARLPLSPLNGAPKSRFVRIEAEEITGRRFPVVDGAVWRNPFTLRRRVPLE